MENNSQPPAPAAPAAKVTPPANEPPKTTQPSSNLEVVPVASRTPAMDGSSAQPQRGTAVVSVPLRSVQQHPQPLSLQVLALAGTGTGFMFGPTAQCGATMPRSPTAVGSLACRPVQQTNPVVFGQGSSSSNQAMQGSSSTQAVAMTALAAATHGPTAQHGAAVPGWLPRAALLPSYRVVRPTKLIVKKLPAPPPPKLPVYRPPPPPRPELPRSSAAGNALLPSSSDTGFCVLNMQADPPSPDQVTMAEEGSDSEGGGGSGDDVQMLDLNFPPVSNNEEN